MSTRKIFSFYFVPLLGLLALAVVFDAHADSLLQTVPTPDTSKLAPETAKHLAAERAGFDQLRAGAVGPPLAQIYANIGALYVRNGFDDAAAVAFYDASQISPHDARWLYLRGVIARRLKRDDDARADFQAALEHDKVYFPIRCRLADTLTDLGDLAGARKLLEDTAREYAQQPVVFAMLGQLALRQKRYGDAVDNINSALKLDPKANELYRHLAAAYAGQGNAKAAEDARAKVGNVTVTLDDPLVAGLYAIAPPQVSGTPIEQAQTLARQGRIGAARERLADILKTDPGDADALALSARIEASMGNTAIAQAEIETALQAKPDSATVNLSSGIVAEHMGDDAKAYDAYRRAQHLDAKYADSYLLLGNAEMRRSHYAQAAEQYRKLATLQADNATAYAHLVAAQVAQGKCADALQTINGALAKRAKDGELMQIFVRVASTCPAASPQERDVALDYGQLLYKQSPGAGNSSALALAMAAHGKFKEAQEYQAEAIFDAVRAGDMASAALYKTTNQQFFDKQRVPDRPWPAQHAYFTAPMLSPVRAAPAAAVPSPAPKS
ncbi:MAG: tetratricopeptide repeat protein [Rudaea sp.]